MARAARVVVVDDHPLLRTGIVETLGRHPDLVVIGEGENAGDACQLVATLRPDLAILDLGMPGDTFSAVRTIVTVSPGTKVVMLTASGFEADLLSSLQSGVKGYVLKGTNGRELIRILLAVHGGGAYVPPELATAALVGRKNGQSAQIEQLTGREDAILENVAQGMTNKEIANKLCMAEKTVKHHMTKIMEKLRARNRVEVALIARERTPASNSDPNRPFFGSPR
jgi:DNA-binding NarL/FixJ family response regulator